MVKPIKKRRVDIMAVLVEHEKRLQRLEQVVTAILQEAAGQPAPTDIVIARPNIDLSSLKKG